MRPILGIVADDLTGGMETAAMLVALGVDCGFVTRPARVKETASSPAIPHARPSWTGTGTACPISWSGPRTAACTTGRIHGGHRDNIASRSRTTALYWCSGPTARPLRGDSRAKGDQA